MNLEPVTTARLTLTPISRDMCRRLLAGNLDGVRAAPGWPQEGTFDGLRMSVERGHPPGWLVVHEGVVIGDCGLHGPPDAEGRVEIGYGLAAGLRGRGLGTELVPAVSGWLLDQPGIRVVRAHTAPDNVASRRVLEKAGFRERGTEEGEVLYELGDRTP